MDFSERIGRRVKLQDLHVLMTVAQAGSMGHAARRLNTTQPAVSRTIAELETAVGVRLFDRSPQGVEPTACGRALLHCSATVFDDLRQGVRNIEFLNDPTLGEIRIGTDEPTMADFLSTVLGTTSPSVSWHHRSCDASGGVGAATPRIARAKDRLGDWTAGLEKPK